MRSSGVSDDDCSVLLQIKYMCYVQSPTTDYDKQSDDMFLCEQVPPIADIRHFAKEFIY